MAYTDLSDAQSSQSVKIAGANPATGVEDNFLEVDTSGRITIKSAEMLYAESGKMWSVTTDLINIAAITETPLFLITNPAGSGKTIKIKKMYFPELGGANVTTYRMYIDSTVTANGTALTPVGRRQVGQSTLSSSIFKSPTISATGTKQLAMHRASAGSIEESVDYDFSIWVEPGHSLLVTSQVSAGGNPCAITVGFAEE